VGSKFYIILDGSADVFIPKDRLNINPNQVKDL
jgi:hypothetical protein